MSTASVVSRSTGVENDDVTDLIVDHVGLVDLIANSLARSWPSHVDRDDLRGAGQVALVECARRWDPGHGLPFERYARRRIKGAMLDAVRDADWAPRSVRARVRLIEATAAELRQRLGREPHHHEVATATGLTVQQVRDACDGGQRAHVHSLDMSAGHEKSTIADILLCPQNGAERKIEDDERRAELAGALQALDERARTVIMGIYGEDRPLADLAEKLGVSDSRISQIHHEALRTLDAMLRRRWEDDDFTRRTKRRRTRIYEASLDRYRHWHTEQRGQLLA